MHDMFVSLNIDAAVKHIKYIVDKIRCPVCDKTDGTRMRYISCGHTSCDDCVAGAPDCSVCLTPLERACREPVADKPLTQRVENAVNLLNVFQNEFHVDVYKRQRISEQLKVEKDLFPECIQAPAKYFNKRKSLRNSKSNKENRLSQLPGEEIPLIWDHKMEQPSENVEIWLDKYVRRPFADLNSNDERLRFGSHSIKKQNVMDTKNASLLGSTRKRSHYKSALSVVKNQLLIDKHLTPVKKNQSHKKPKVENNSCVKSETFKCVKTGINIKSTDNNESGIGMDDEDVIVIDDSQSTQVDKDMNAWLAVQEAEKNKQNGSATINLSSKSREHIPQDKIEKAIEADVKLITKVPFYLMGHLSENCIDCNVSNHDGSDTNIAGPIKSKIDMETSKDVLITVENKTFTAVITVNRIESTEKQVNTMQSVEVQTEILDSMIDNKKIVNQISPKIACDLSSQGLLRDDGKTIENINNTVCKGENMKSLNKIPNIIIEESDSDGEPEASVSLEVTAEIHRSCEAIDYGILADIDNLEQHSKRARRAARGFTPTSTDSSDKENYNPNKKKQAPTSKKKPMKK